MPDNIEYYNYSKDKNYRQINTFNFFLRSLFFMNKKHEFKIRIRYVDIDGMKIIHNSKYPIYFEEARIDLVNKENYPYAQIEQDGFIFPISELKILYKNSIYYGEEITVKVWLEYLKNYSMKFKYQIMKQNEIIACEGYTIHAVIDKSTMDFTEVPEKLHNILKEYVEKK